MDCLLCLQSTIKKKSGRLEKFLSFARSHSIVTRGSVSLTCATTPFLLFLILPVLVNRYVAEVAFSRIFHFTQVPIPRLFQKLIPFPGILRFSGYSDYWIPMFRDFFWISPIRIPGLSPFPGLFLI